MYEIRRGECGQFIYIQLKGEKNRSSYIGEIYSSRRIFAFRAYRLPADDLCFIMGDSPSLELAILKLIVSLAEVGYDYDELSKLNFNAIEI